VPKLKLWACGVFFFTYLLVQVCVPIAPLWSGRSQRFAWSMYARGREFPLFLVVYADGRQVPLAEVRKHTLVGYDLGAKVDVVRFVPRHVCAMLPDAESVWIIRVASGKRDLYPCRE
jgi:hypothetical protein